MSMLRNRALDLTSPPPDVPPPPPPLTKMMAHPHSNPTVYGSSDMPSPLSRSRNGPNSNDDDPGGKPPIPKSIGNPGSVTTEATQPKSPPALSGVCTVTGAQLPQPQPQARPVQSDGYSKMRDRPQQKPDKGGSKRGNVKVHMHVDVDKSYRNEKNAAYKSRGCVDF